MRLMMVLYMLRIVVIMMRMVVVIVRRICTSGSDDLHLTTNGRLAPTLAGEVVVSGGHGSVVVMGGIGLRRPSGNGRLHVIFLLLLLLIMLLWMVLLLILLLLVVVLLVILLLLLILVVCILRDVSGLVPSTARNVPVWLFGFVVLETFAECTGDAASSETVHLSVELVLGNLPALFLFLYCAICLSSND